MVRLLVAIVFLTGAVGLMRAEDKDPIKDKLLAAKAAYDKEMEQYHKQTTDWLNKREEQARKDGNKKLLDQVKLERKAFEETGELPSTAPVTFKQKHDRAKKAMDAAYAEAVKAYTKAKKDDEAASVEEAWKVFKEGSAIDLLALVDPKEHAVSGEWKKEGTALVGTATNKGGREARLRLPYEPGEEYDFELTCRRLTGDDCICLGLVAGGRQTAAMVDGWPWLGCLAGIDVIDGKRVPDNGTMVKGVLLKIDTDHTITGSVREGKIDLLVDKKPIASFKGEFTRLSLQNGYGPPTPKSLFLVIGPKCSFRIDRLKVSPVKGKGTITK
jgi:hypothetical protein